MLPAHRTCHAPHALRPRCVCAVLRCCAAPWRAPRRGCVRLRRTLPPHFGHAARITRRTAHQRALPARLTRRRTRSPRSSSTRRVLRAQARSSAAMRWAVRQAGFLCVTACAVAGTLAGHVRLRLCQHVRAREPQHPAHAGPQPCWVRHWPWRRRRLLLRRAAALTGLATAQAGDDGQCAPRGPRGAGHRRAMRRAGPHTRNPAARGGLFFFLGSLLDALAR